MKLECPVKICFNDLFTIWNRHLKNGHQEKDSLYIKHKEKKMNKFLEAIDTVNRWILGDRRDGDDRRVKKSRRKTTKRKTVRRKSK